MADGVVYATSTEAAPVLEPEPGVMVRVTGTADGKVVSVIIALPASGVQSFRRDLRVALQELPLEDRQQER